MSKRTVMKPLSQFKLFLDLSALPRGLEIETMRAGYGISKSVVSREVVAATTELDRFRSRSLEDFDLCVL
ncbi:MAG: hypothetical protein KFH87_05185 [Bacteroidetes bacterium]|nr:hypothetical protein [Bacteroidota bacterium]